MSSKVIGYIGLFPFPYGQAASKRVLGNILLLQSLGYNVIVGHGGDTEKEFNKEGTHIKYYGLGELFSGSKGIVRLFNLIFRGGGNTINWLNSLSIKPDYLIVYGGYYGYSNKILKYCKKNNIKIIFDVVEWYEPAQMMGGKYGLFYNSFMLAFKYIYPQADAIISISTNLEDVFKKNITVRIPPLVSTQIQSPCLNKSDNGALSLIYAGNIGNKDSLFEIIQVVEKLSLTHNIKLDIFGPSEAELKLKYNVQSFSEKIQIHGKVKQEDINSVISKADFTIFTRPDTHCNRYGFPSKFVESLSLGVPVVTNLTSDIGLYLKDEYNGFIVDNCSKEAIEACVQKMLRLSVEQKNEMKRNAIKVAEDSFSSKSTFLRTSVSEFFTYIDDELDT